MKAKIEWIKVSRADRELIEWMEYIKKLTDAYLFEVFNIPKDQFINNQ